MFPNTLNDPPKGTIAKQTPRSPLRKGRVIIMLTPGGFPLLDTEGNAIVVI